MKLKFTSAILASVVASASFAAVTDVEMEFQPLSKKKQAKMAKKPSVEGNCSFVVNDFKDERQNKQTISYGHNATGVVAWLNEATNYYTKGLDNSDADVNILVQPTLVRLYSYPESMNINGVTAIVVTYLVDGNEIDTRYYRGFYGKTNWANGDGEYVTALNDSIHNLMPKLVSDFSNVCSVAAKV